MEQIDKFKKHSRWGTIFTAVGAGVMVVSVLVFIYLNDQKDSNLAVVKGNLDQKDSITHALKKELILEKKQNKTEVVECTANLLKQKMPNGEPLYLFTLRICDSTLFPDLKKVGYYFDHPSYNPRLKISTTQSNHFAVSYKGWGCMNTVPVYLYHEDASIDTILFNMCEKTKIVLDKQ
jgi:hypothetical protein